jgi:hypothetical protein
MNRIQRNSILLFILIPIAVSSLSVPYPVKPHIINLTREDYHAGNKNWSVSRDEKGVMYFGNDIGLLEFDGIEWRLNKLPNSSIARSVAVQSYKTVFTGGYEEFGRWDRDISGRLVYTSLSDKLDKAMFGNDDFWKIWVTDSCVYFQSFTSIYVYDYHTVTRVPSERGFLFLSRVRNEFLVQQMLGALYRLEGLELSKIEGSDIFQNTDVRVILPYADDKYLIGTATKGIYIYDGQTFTEWNPALSAIMSRQELNCGFLSSKGTYFFGTILDGVYQVDVAGKILNHISTKSTMQNNTVLSLYEDNLNNIWVALDKGISYIQYIDNMSCYIDPGGTTGAVYGAAFWKDRLFIGTNQGVFYVSKEDMDSPDALSKMKLVDGTQGQVWALKVIDGMLYCCHNKGLKEIRENLSVTDVFNVGTGVYNLSEDKIKDRELLFLSTYHSLRIVDKKTKKVFNPGQISEPIINVEVDHLGNVWLEHFNKGVYRCMPDDDLSGFRSFSYYGGNNSDGLPYKLKIFKVGGRIVLLGDNTFYTYDDIADKIVTNTLLDDCFKNIKNLKQVIAIRDNMFWALTNTSVHKFFYDGYQASILESYDLGMGMSLVNGYENISVLNDSVSLICLDNGFLLYSKSGESKVNKPHPPHLESLQAQNMAGISQYEDLSKYAKISYSYNTITFSFSTNDACASNVSFP